MSEQQTIDDFMATLGEVGSETWIEARDKWIAKATELAAAEKGTQQKRGQIYFLAN